jgi:hypothetical protein
MRLRIVPLALILLSTVLSSPSRAQFLPRADGYRLVRMGYTNTSGENGVTIFYYGRDGALAWELWMLNDRSRYSANGFVLDDQGRVIEKYREFSDSLTSTETYRFDDAGQRVAETFARSDGVTGSAAYLWNDDGRVQAAECDKYKGWFSGRIDYEYSGGVLSGAVISRGDERIGEITYGYDEIGRLAQETWDFGGTWSQTFSYEYEAVPERVADASHPLMAMNSRFHVVAEDYDFDGRVGGPSTYEYDSDGLLVKKVFTRDDGLRTETTYTFDAAGSLVSSHRVYHDGRTADFTYTHDARLRLTGKHFQRSDGQEGAEAYTYDRFGRLEQATYRNMDFWLNGVIRFTYDTWGHIDGGHFDSNNGDDADLTIDTDEHGNVLRVHWQFDSGHTQTYHFDYAPIHPRG